MKIQEQLFALIRAGIWNIEPDKEPFIGITEQEWNELYRLALGGAVVSVCYDALLKLPIELRPARKLLFKWFTLAEKRQAHNRHCAEILGRLTQWYNSDGVEFVLLKGLGVAELYHNPLLRDGGDIDLIITKNYRAANELLEKKGAKKNEDNIKHKTYHYNGVAIENHRQLAMTPAISKILTELLVDTVQTSNGVKIPTPTFNSVYLVEHIAMHFFTSGIGFRHLCDLCMLFSQGGIDAATCRDGIRRIGAEPLFARLIAIMVRHLGADKSLFPIEPIYDSYTDRILSDIVFGGNFGLMTKNNKQTKILQKANTMWVTVRRCYGYRRIGGAIFSQQIKELLMFNFGRFLGAKG